MLRTAIVEDNLEDLKRLSDMLRHFSMQCGEEWHVVSFSNGPDFLKAYRPIYDLVLMDVEMPVMNGIEVAKELRTRDTSVLIMFITNMAQYAVSGYEVDALDYVIKPVSYYAFEMKMKKVQRILREQAGKDLCFFLNGEMRRIPVRSILYVEIHDHDLCYHTEEGELHMTGSMKKLEQELAPYPFARCNNCYLVNLIHVRAVTADVVWIEETPLKISRPRRKTFMQALSNYYGGGGR